MAPDEFKTIRVKLGASKLEMAKALRLKSSRSVFSYESGERNISGTIERHMLEFKEGKPL